MFDFLYRAAIAIEKIPVLGAPITLLRQIKKLMTIQVKITQLYDLIDTQLHAVDGLNGAINSVQDRLINVENRLEFSRQETLLEIQRALRNGESTTISEMTVSRIVDESRYEEQKNLDEIRINLGCGHKPIEGYLNVDARELPGVQVVAAVNDLPFEEGTLSEIFSAHLMEHFRQDEIVNELLPYWYGLLKKGGRFRAVVPDGEAMTKSFAAGEMSFEDYRLVTYGGQEYQGNFHYTMYSAESLSTLLRNAGFQNVTVIDRGRRNGLCLELEVAGEKLAA